MANDKSSSIRIRVEGDALDRLNVLSQQFRLSRTQIVTLLVESVSEQDVANAMLSRTIDTNQEQK